MRKFNTTQPTLHTYLFCILYLRPPFFSFSFCTLLTLSPSAPNRICNYSKQHMVIDDIKKFSDYASPKSPILSTLSSISLSSLISHHLSLFGHFLDVSDDFLLLLLKPLSLFIQVPHRPVQSSLVLPQHLLRCLPLPKQEIHLHNKPGTVTHVGSFKTGDQYKALHNPSLIFL